MENDDCFESEWIDDIASLISAAILILFVLMFVAVGFWLWGWI